MGRVCPSEQKPKRFCRPSPAQEAAALGRCDNVWGELFRADLPAIPKPRGEDWLCVREERGQSVASFQRLSCRATLHSKYRTLFLQPMGAWAAEPGDVASPCMEAVVDYVRAFFPGLQVEQLQPLELADDPPPGREHPDAAQGHPQLLTQDVYAALRKVRGRRDVARTAVAVLGVTGADLCPGEDWDHVCGEALPMDTVAVVSWYRQCRWDPELAEVGQAPPSDLILRRMVCTTCHEVCHMFGLQHCIYRHCLMNGTNHQVESDARPTFLCPICLRKLYLALNGSIAEQATDDETRKWLTARYVALEGWFVSQGLEVPTLAQLLHSVRG